jgi:hypothetical protein
MSTAILEATELLSRPKNEPKAASSRLKMLSADVRNTPRYLVRYSILVLAIFGGLSIWDAHGDGRIPIFVSLLPGCGINPAHIPGAPCSERGTSAAVRWQGLSSSLKILDEVNPEIAKWVRQRQDAGAVVFSDADLISNDQCAALAKYDSLSGKLTIQRGLFAQRDGNIAAIFAHEYRHSRQSYPKIVRYALSFMFAKGGDSSIVENDAEIYERQAKNAIYGEYSVCAQ